MKRCVEIKKENYLRSIKQLSFDKTNNISLCKYKNRFLDFEEIVKIRKSNELPKAVDMLYIDDEKKEIWFIEFKNKEKEKIDKFDVKRKILDSLISFYELFDDNNLRCKYTKNYFVVYKCSNDSFEEMYNEFEDIEIYFELEEIKNKFLECVITECCEFFIKYFENNNNINWEE